MNRKQRMAQFEAKAEKLYAFGGDENLVGADNFYGGHGMNHMSGANIGVLDDSDRTMTMTITNTSGATQTAVLFNANKPLVTIAGLTIDVDESSHEEVREDSKVNPFTILGFKYNVTSVAQLSNSWTVKSGTPTGAKLEKKVSPLTYRSANQQIATQVDAPAYVLGVDGRTSIEISVLDGEVITIIFTLTSRGNQGDILKGGNTLRVASGKAPTGIPQIDIAQGRRI